MSAHRNPNDLAELKRLLEALAVLKTSYLADRARLRGDRAAEVTRLRRAGWTPQALAVALGLRSRTAVTQWQDPPEPQGDADAGVH